MRPLFVFLSLSLCLAACTPPTATPLPAPTARPTFAPTKTLRPGESTPTTAPPAPTLALITLHYVGLSAAPEILQHAAQEFGWQFEQTPEAAPEAIRAAAESGAQIIVVGGEELQEPARTIAPEFPQVYFVGFGLEASGLPPNLLSLGGPESRQDQAGFLAGMVAGYATQNQRVAVVGDPNATEGRKYRNGFLHGVRYACPKCRVDFIDVAETDATRASAEAAKYVLYGTDVIYAAAGSAGDTALVTAAQNGAWVISSGFYDVYSTVFDNGLLPGADHVLTSVYMDVGAAGYKALTDYKNGKPRYGVQPFSVANGAIILAPYRNADGPLNALEQSYIAAALVRLADGSLETGIDPVTGEEK